MSHEQSETIFDPETGKWVNVYGEKTPKAGRPIPGSGMFDSVEEAVEAARRRSKSFDHGHDVPRNPAPPRGSGGVRGAAPDDYKYGRLRQNLPPDHPWHAMLGPLEHREFVRDAVKRDGMLAPALAVATPAYTVGKLAARVPDDAVAALPFPLVPLVAAGREAARQAGLHLTRSPPSMDEVFAGFEGLFSGVRDRYRSGI